MWIDKVKEPLTTFRIRLYTCMCMCVTLMHNNVSKAGGLFEICPLTNIV